MATLRPAKCYRSIERPWTRQSQKKPRKGYVKGVPESKIHKFNIGNLVAAREGKFQKSVSLVASRAVQIRSNALEAARVATHKQLTKTLGEENFFFKIFPYPHHVLRENPLASGAGADRFQTGMRLSFGKPIGSAAQVKVGQTLIKIWFHPGKEREARRGLQVAKAKFPTPSRII